MKYALEVVGLNAKKKKKPQPRKNKNWQIFVSNLEKNAIHCFVFKSFLRILLINYLRKMCGYPLFSFGMLRVRMF